MTQSPATIIASEYLRRNLEEILIGLAEGNTYIITKYGKPVAMMTQVKTIATGVVNTIEGIGNND